MFESAEPMPPTALRVLHISSRSDHGGGPEHIRQVVGAGLRDIEHHVACPASGIYWERYRGMVGEQRLCPIPVRRLTLPGLLRLRAFIASRRIQVIHSHGMGGGVYGRVLGLVARLPVLHTFHGVPRTPGLKHRVYQLAEHGLSLMTGYGIAVSAGEADIVHARWHRYRGRLAVVPNGIGVGSTPPPWSPWPSAGPLRLVSFSRRNHQKHPELLIGIARGLRERGVAARIDAYGEGLDHPELAAAAARAGVGAGLHFHPPTDDPGAALAGAQIYLSTSRWEGMPLAILEAWRAGLVVVASDVVGNRDLIRDGRTGRLFPAGEAETAVQVVAELAGDVEAVERIRMRAASIADRDHAHDLMALRLAWLYRCAAAGMRVADGEWLGEQDAASDAPSGMRIAGASLR